MIVDRILKIIELKGINKSIFYRETGLSNGFLDKVKDIGVSKIENIISAYPDINPEWLLLGKGEILKEGFNANHYSNNVQSNIVSEGSIVYQSNTEEVEQLKQRIEDLEKIIETQKLLIDVLNKN